MPDTKTSTRVPNISVQDAQTTLNGQIAALDPQRAKGLAGLTRARSAKAAMLGRDQRRASQKYGARDPRVQALADRRTLNATLQAQVAFHAAQAAVAQPTPDPNRYTLHGHVIDAQLAPQPGLTVALYDANGAWIRAMGYACTDAQGYFRLDYPRDQQTGAQPPGSTQAPPAPAPPASGAPPEASPPPGPGATPGASTGQPAEAPASAAEIRVFNATQKLLYRSSDLLHPQLGKTDYRRIILDPQGACSPPPDSAKNAPPV